MTTDLLNAFNWINWFDPVQNSWATGYFSKKADREINSSRSLLHWYQGIPENSRNDLVRRSKNAWAAKSSRNNKELQTKKPVQVHLSKEARDYLTKTAKLSRKTRSELIEEILKNQEILHNKISQENKKLNNKNKFLLDQFQRQHVIEMSRIEYTATLKEKVHKLEIEIAQLKNSSTSKIN